MKLSKLFRKPLFSKKPFILVFVCKANRTRSPYARARFLSLLQDTLNPFDEKHQRGITVLSAGVQGTLGDSVLPLMTEVSAERGLELDAHLARPFDLELARNVDLVITMDGLQKDVLLKRFPRLKKRIYKLTEFDSDCQGDKDSPAVPDPTGFDLNAHRKIADILDEELARILPAVLDRALK